MVVAVPPEFSPFGPGHLVALLLTGLATALLVAWARGRRGEPVTKIPARVLALAMLAAQFADPYCRHLLGTLDWQHALPVEICDLASFACVFALLTRRPLAFELAYFWGLAGTLQALLTPAVARGFPHLEFLRFFLLHGAIVVGVFYLGPGLGMTPRRGAVWRVYGLTVVHAVFVGLLDWALGANYMFLRVKPAGSVLDVLGPWPIYLLTGAALAAVLFSLLDLPYRRGRRGRARTTGAA